MSDHGPIRHPPAEPTHAAPLEGVFVSLTGGTCAMSDHGPIRHPPAEPTHAAPLEGVFVSLTGRHLRHV